MPSPWVKSVDPYPELIALLHPGKCFFDGSQCLLDAAYTWYGLTLMTTHRMERHKPLTLRAAPKGTIGTYHILVASLAINQYISINHLSLLSPQQLGKLGLHPVAFLFQ
jgi:hypothetical protein